VAQHDRRTVITDDHADMFAAITGECSQQARTYTWHPRTTRTGSRRPGNRAVGGMPWFMTGWTVLSVTLMWREAALAGGQLDAVADAESG